MFRESELQLYIAAGDYVLLVTTYFRTRAIETITQLGVQKKLLFLLTARSHDRKFSCVLSLGLEGIDIRRRSDVS